MQLLLQMQNGLSIEWQCCGKYQSSSRCKVQALIRSICPRVQQTLNAFRWFLHTYGIQAVLQLLSITVSPASDKLIISFTVTDANGLSVQADTTRVTVNPLPSISAGADSEYLYRVQQFQLRLQKKNKLFVESGGINNSKYLSWLLLPAMKLCSDRKLISNGCSGSDTMHVTVNSAPVVNIPTSLYVPGFSTILDCGKSGFHLWLVNRRSYSNYWQ